MLDLAREITQTMRTNKVRTVLTGLAVAWGIFMLIILLGLARGVFNSFDDFTSKREQKTVRVRNGSTTMPYKGYNKGRWIKLKDTDINALVNAHDNKYIRNAVAVKYIDSAKVSTQRDYISNGLQGVFPQTMRLSGVDMYRGRFINETDIREMRKVTVLSKKSAETLFGDADNAIGQRVTSLGLSWHVVGVYTREWNEDETFVPFSTAMMMSGNNGEVHSFRVLIGNVANEADGEKAEEEIRRILAREHKFAPDDKGAVGMWNQFTNELTTRSALGILDIAIWVIGIFTMLSGIVGVSNIMFVSVRERTHEIGIRRAIGAKPRNILTQIVLESVSITTIFGYIGIVAGMLVMQLVAAVVGESDGFKNPTVDLSIAIKVTVVLIIAGALAGVFPALKATKVKPVEALRDE